MNKDRLFTPSYICILAANFLLFFGFWLLIPVLPFYLKETYNCPTAIIGTILSCYTVSCMCIRPFSGFIMDKFPRKPIYLLCYFVFVAVFLGYIVAATLLWFVILRAIHGVAFGGVTVGGNTLCVDIMPSSRRGEGLGYYGLTNNTAMALGPMTGLMLHGQIDYHEIFIAGMAASTIGLLCAIAIKPKQKTTDNGLSTNKENAVEEKPKICTESEMGNIATSDNANNEANLNENAECENIKADKHKLKLSLISLDRFILLKGIPVSISLIMLSIPYGSTTNFVAMYANEINLDIPTGFFFTLMAIGMGVSRIIAGKKVDRGYITQCIHFGFYPVILAFALLGSCRFIAAENTGMADIVFFTVPVLLGIGFGVMFPAMNSLYINLAPHNRRATATSTYLSSWDVGIGIGIVSSGIIAHYFTFYMVYLTGAVICTISMIFFVHKVTPHYNRNKLR